jgi:hypothetical protein
VRVDPSSGLRPPSPRWRGEGSATSFLHQLHVETETLELANQNIERLGETRDLRDLALDDRLVDLLAAFDVVRLRSQELLQRVRGAVRFESPHFHLSETLAAELRLAAERLLRDE